MNIVDEFQQQLSVKSRHLYASWHKVDLHNHSTSSFDYAGNKETAAKDSADYINQTGLSVVKVTSFVEERTELRRKKLDEFERALDDKSLKLELLAAQDSESLQEYSNKYRY